MTLALQNLTQQQLVGVFTDLLTAASDRFTNASEDVVAAEDIAAIAASIDVPGAEEAEVAIVILTALGTVLYPLWVPPWSPDYVPPNADADPSGHPAR